MKDIMQISLTSDTIDNIKNRYYGNLNRAASNDFRQASTYREIHKLVGKDGFAKFLTEYFNYDEKQIERADLMQQARQVFTSNRTWMRVGGYKGIKRLFAIQDEDKRTQVLDMIRKPKGAVNFSITDLETMIKSDGKLSSDSVTFFVGLRGSRTRRDSQNKDRKRIRSEVRNEVQKVLKSRKRSRSRSRSRKRRQPANV